MKRAVAAVAFTAILVLSLIASTGEASAATLDTRTSAAIVDGRGSTNKPAPTAPTAPATFAALRQLLSALGVTWE